MVADLGFEFKCVIREREGERERGRERERERESWGSGARG